MCVCLSCALSDPATCPHPGHSQILNLLECQLSPLFAPSPRLMLSDSQPHLWGWLLIYTLCCAFSQPTSPEENFGQQTAHFTIGPPETSLETPPLTTVPPVPKPRTLQPGKGVERRPSGGKPVPNNAPPVAGATMPPPLQVPPLVPQVPPRRKKSAPATFNLQVLQSNSQLLQGLTCSSSPSSDCPPARQPDGGALLPQPAFLGTSSAASPETDGPKELKSEAASLLDDHQDPFWSLLQHPKLLNNAWLSKSSNRLDTGTTNLGRAHTAPPHVSASAAEEPPAEHRQKDFGHWVTVSDKDKRTVLQVFDPLAKT